MQIPFEEVHNENQAGHNGTTGVKLETAMQLRNEKMLLEVQITNYS